MMHKFGRIGVLAGGPSNEREISLRSGQAVHNALIKEGIETIFLDIFDDLNKQGSTFIIVTHDEHIAARTMRVIRLRDGEVVSDVWN